MRLNALFRLAFATATPPGLTSPHTTNSQAHSSKGTPSPYFPNGKVLGSDGLQADGFRHYFTPLPGYFSPFPHGTNPLSVTREYSALPDGPGKFTANFRSSPLLEDPHTQTTRFRLPGSHRLRRRTHSASANERFYHCAQDCQLPHGGPHDPI
jgi:hypothetical protein